MNKQRKQKIRQVITNIEICRENLENLLDEEQDYFDNIPENLQGSIRGSNSEDAIDIMESCIDSLEDVISELEDI